MTEEQTAKDSKQSEGDDDKNKENLIPQSRFDQATGRLKDDINRYQTENERLHHRVTELEKPKEGQSEPDYTREQLRGFVKTEQITQEQADDYWDKQQDRKHTATAKALVDEAVANVTSNSVSTSTKSGLTKAIDEYIDIVPGLATEGSDDRDKIHVEYTRLTKTLGVPKANSVQDLQLQKLALENLYGSTAQLSSKLKKTSDLQTLQDVGSTKPDIPKTGKLSDLSPRQRAHYEMRIDQGMYKSWNDVEAELNYKRRKDRPA